MICGLTGSRSHLLSSRQPTLSPHLNMEQETDKKKQKKQKKNKKKHRSGQSESGVSKTEASAFHSHRCEESNGCNVLADDENSVLPVSKTAADVDVRRIDLFGGMGRFHWEHSEAERCKLVESSVAEDLDTHSDSSELRRKAEFEMKFRGDINASTEMITIPSKEDERTELKSGKGCEVETASARSVYTGTHPTSSENEALVNELKEALQIEAVNSNTLKNRVSLLEAQVAARDMAEASIRCEIEELRNENAELQKEVEEMKEYVERLLLEREQLTAKMLAMQRGMQHGLTEDNFTRSSKRNADDPVENGPAMTEESKIQMAAAARMIEKLVAENSELVEKVNEQSGFIDRLTQRYSSLVESQSLQLEKDDPEIKYMSDTVKLLDREHEPRAEQVIDFIIPTETVASEIRQASHQEQTLVYESLLMESTENGLSIATHLSTTGTPENSIESLVELTRPSLEQATQVSGMTNEIVPSKQKESVPFSDAPLMGAPIRLLSFMAHFVSGADLVKTKYPKG